MIQNSFGQNFETLLVESFHNTFGKEEFETETNYKLYKGIDGAKVFETYSGVSARKGKQFYQKIGPMEFLIGENFFVKLNRDDEEITIGNSPNADFGNSFSLGDIAQLLKYYCEVSISNDKGYLVMEMDANPEERTDIAKMKIYIKNGKITKQIFYLSQVKDFSIYGKNESEKVYDVARLEVHYNNIKYNATNSFFLKERYFTVKNNKIILGKEFKQYEFFPAN